MGALLPDAPGLEAIMLGNSIIELDQIISLDQRRSISKLFGGDKRKPKQHLEFLFSHSNKATTYPPGSRIKEFIPNKFQIKFIPRKCRIQDKAIPDGGRVELNISIPHVVQARFEVILMDVVIFNQSIRDAHGKVP